MEDGYLFQPPPMARLRQQVIYTHSLPLKTGHDLLDKYYLPFGHRYPFSHRRRHLRRTFDLLHLLLLRGDTKRAARALAVLMQSYEWKYSDLWRLGMHVMGKAAGSEGRIEYLKNLSLRNPNLRLPMLLEQIPEMINAKQYAQAVEELDLVIHTYPFRTEPALHVYLGLLTLHSATEAALEDARQQHQIEVQAHDKRVEQDEEEEPGRSPPTFHGLPYGLESLDNVMLQSAIRHFQTAVEVSRANLDDKQALLLKRLRYNRRRTQKSQVKHKRLRASKLRMRTDIQESDAEDDLVHDQVLGQDQHISQTEGESDWTANERGWTDTDMDDDMDPAEREQRRRIEEKECALLKKMNANLSSERQEPWACQVARSFLDVLKGTQPSQTPAPYTSHYTAITPQPSSKKRKRQEA